MIKTSARAGTQRLSLITVKHFISIKVSQDIKINLGIEPYLSKVHAMQIMGLAGSYFQREWAHVQGKQLRHFLFSRLSTIGLYP